MRQFGLIGFPLAHSFSKKYFTEKFEREGLKDCSYENFPLPSVQELKKILDDHKDLQGLNVTIPYKESVLQFLDDANELVRKTGACNCIKITGKKLTGYNTDVIGFEKSLQTMLQPSHKNALILGTGGSAKAVEFVLKKLDISYKYVSRKPSVKQFSYEQLTSSVIEKHTLIINTTPLGMYPNVTQAAPIPYNAITKDHFLFDLIYNPEKTLFLQKGEQQGATIQNGYDMLVCQAEESWRIWNN